MPDRVETTLEALRANRFTVHRAATPAQARAILLEEIVPGTRARTVSYGDSLTLFSLGVLERIQADPGLELIDTFDPGADRATLMTRRRAALHADLFLLGANAVTLDGRLVNLDMVGNRVGGLVFGPRHAAVVAGANKLVDGLDAAMERIRTHCAPINAARHHARTPCAKTGVCADCASPERICNVWTITEKSYPPGRIHVLLLDGEHGI